MNSKVRRGMIKDIEANVNNFEKLALTDDDRTRGLNVIGKEIKILSDSEKQKAEIKILKERFKLEKIKVENQIENENKKIEIELEKLDFERFKLTLEEARLQNDLNKQQEEIKAKKVDRWVNIGMKVLEIGIPLAVNTILILWNFRLVYKDDGVLPSSIKDLMRHILKK